jgi:hypothetical protein
VARLGHFLALRPAQQEEALDALAADCVRLVDRFRRAPTADELDHRRGGLTHRQTLLLERWGYPWVFEEYRFHITLTTSLNVAAERRAKRALASVLGDALGNPVPVDGIALFHQSAPGGAFHLIERFPFLARYSQPEPY